MDSVRKAMSEARTSGSRGRIPLPVLPLPFAFGILSLIATVRRAHGPRSVRRGNAQTISPPQRTFARFQRPPENGVHVWRNYYCNASGQNRTPGHRTGPWGVGVGPLLLRIRDGKVASAGERHVRERLRQAAGPRGHVENAQLRGTAQGGVDKQVCPALVELSPGRSRQIAKGRRRQGAQGS